MAGRPAVMIILDRTRWQLARLTSEGVETTPLEELSWTNVEDVARSIATFLDQWKVRRRRVVVGLKSSLCISSLLRLPTPKQARQRQTLAYLLEPFLPWSAEEMVADFECSRADAFAVAIAIEPLAILIKQLEDSGVQVESIAPLARLALHGGLTPNPVTASRLLVLWGDGSHADLWLVDRNRPLMWRHLPLETRLIQQEVQQVLLDEPNSLPLAFSDVPDELTAQLSTSWEIVPLRASPLEPLPMLNAALHAAADILSGASSSPIEFRRDQLAGHNRYRAIHSSLRVVQVACLSLFLATGFALYQLGEQFDQLRREASDRQTEIFRKLFPDAPVPVGVRSRLESEYAKLKGMRGDTVEFVHSPSAIGVVERLLRALPTDMRYRILEVRVEQGRMYVVGQVREHADADRIAEELRKMRLSVESPSTHRLPQKGVEFRISAQFPVMTEASQGGPR